MIALILAPLRVLRDLLRGPRNLIKKRLDKLLDYELISEKSSLSYEEQAVASTYRWGGEMMGCKRTAAQVISDSASSRRTINTLLVNELPQFNSLALQMIWSVLGTFSCLHRDLAADMEQLFQSFAQQVSSASAFSLVDLLHTRLSSSPSPPQLSHSSLAPRAFWEWAESAVLEGARRFETLCLSMQDTLNAPVAQVSSDPLRTSDTVSQTNTSVRPSLSPSSASESVFSAPSEAADGQTRFWKDLPGCGDGSGQSGPGPESG